MNDRVVVSEHKTRTGARAARRLWKRRQTFAAAGNNRALAKLRAAGIGTNGALHVEHGGRNEREKWALIYG
jgi:hypothetical protein